jgi:hypothetical protein
VSVAILPEVIMYKNNREREKERHKFNDTGFRQNHAGRERFPEGEWGSSSEYGRNSGYRESDSFHADKQRPFGRDKNTGRQYSIAGVDFDVDERDDDLYGRDYNRSRFAEPYTGGQFSRSQYGIGGQFNRDRSNFSSRGYGETYPGFSGVGPKGYKRSDERIYEEVCEALYRNPLVDASDIEVKVSEGIVTLSGAVDGRNAKREAESCIENLAGVEDIQNELRLVNKGTELKENRPEH